LFLSLINLSVPYEGIFIPLRPTPLFSCRGIALLFQKWHIVAADMMERHDWIGVQEELNQLYELHEKGVSDSGKCREFNSRSSLFLQRLEELEAFDIADRVMDLLAGCSPKDFSPCDNRLSTKGSLERLQDRIRDKVEKG
jgi:hypothetical protein